MTETDLLPSIRSRNPLRWLSVFGPGAIIASLTIGTGELVFSSRGGAVFGYAILWVFVAISLLKWTLVFSTARHLVLSGAHPFQRSMALPGPRGWFPLLFFLPAVICFPIWVGFHSGVIGTLLAELSGANTHVAAFVALGVVLVPVAVGSYTSLERAQLVVVSLMLASVAMSVVLLRPDWLDVLEGLFVPRSLRYPDWLPEAAPEIAARPIWVETSTYVGVIGGASYDYLAYLSFLREKGWGNAGLEAPASDEEIAAVAATPSHPARLWLRAPLVDATVSFAVVILFSAVFVVSGTLVLGPARKIPTGDNLLNLQAEFVTRLHEWLLPLYISGALLAMAGTLYGTIEVAPAVAREVARALFPKRERGSQRTLRRLAVGWCAAGAVVVLLWRAWPGATAAAENPPTLVELVTPANLFTGVFSCGLVCLLAPWMDLRFLPRALRMSWLLVALNLLAAGVFLAIGLRSFHEWGAPRAIGGAGAVAALLGFVPLAWLAAWALARRRGDRD